MQSITIFLENFRQFGCRKDKFFCLITNTHLLDKFIIHKGDEYQGYKIISYDPETDFVEILKHEIPDNSHILVIAPNCYFRAPEAQELGNNKKLCVMACNSTFTSIEAINHFIGCVEKTDPYEQEKIVDRFFVNCEATEVLKFVDREYGTTAELNHLNDRLQWHEQIGEIEWGGQQLFPSGEVSVLPLDIFASDLNTKIDINGQLAFKGFPIVHSGTSSFLPEDRERIFHTLSTIQEHALIINLERGLISKIEASHPSVQQAANMLNAMCEVDSRYKMIIEIGFGINYHLQLFPGNCAMNEVYADSPNGTVHFGLGLIPHTQYHLDIICPSLKVLGGQERLLFG